MDKTAIQASVSPAAGPQTPLDETAIQTGLTPGSATSGRSDFRTRPSGVWHLIKTVLAPIASLRLTVALFVLAIGLVFVGTLAQKDEGMYTVLHHYFRSWGIAWIPYQALVRFGQVFFGVSAETRVAGAFPYPSGGTLGAALLINLLAAHLVRFKLTWKRSGILVLHSGLIILLVSELVTWQFAVESYMTIVEGNSANYVEDARLTELYFSTPTTSEKDDVTVVPASLLHKDRVLRDDALPCDVEVLQFMKNSDSGALTSDNLATAGTGLRVAIVEKPEISGTDIDQRSDMASAYVTFKKKGSGESLGTYVVSAWFQLPQKLTIDGKTYEIGLRPRRTYKPYNIELLEFRHDVYPGTDTPSNFSSQVRITDAAKGEDREYLISMNDPLRHAGLTFYQGGYLQDGRKGTILQVVRNPGWLMPYISCILVGVGLVVHFGIHLVGFLGRRVAK